MKNIASSTGITSPIINNSVIMIMLGTKSDVFLNHIII